MKSKYLFILALTIAFSTTKLAAQEVVNGGFELTKADQMPRNWIKSDGEGQFDIAVSTARAHTGKQALKISRNATKIATKATAIAANNYGDFGSTKIHHIELTAWLYNSNPADSTVALFIQNGQQISYAYLKAQKKIGWQKHSLVFTTDKELYRFYYGIEVNGNTTVWCDDVSLKVNGKLVTDPSSLYQQPSTASIKWLDQNLTAIKSTKPGLSNEDLLPIGTLTDKARIISIGEPTHGTSEAGQFKIRMLEYLVKEKGFTTVALEEVIPTCDILNGLLQQQNAAIRDSLVQLPMYKTWKTEEMLQLLTWVNTYNLSHARKVKFIGIDMEDIRIKSARAMLKNYARLKSPTLLKQSELIDQNLDALLNANTKGVNAQTMALAEVLKKDLAQLQQLILAANLPKENDERFNLLSYVRVCQQWLESRFYEGNRDQYMADNLAFYLDEHPAEKVMLWAHNLHAANTTIGGAKTMGAHLKDKFGAGYFPISITAASGSYMAAQDYTQKKWESYPLENAYQGTYEFTMNKAKAGTYFLGLANLKPDQRGSAWLNSTMKQLDLSYIYTAGEDHYKYYGNLAQVFDGVVFFKKTTATKSLIMNK